MPRLAAATLACALALAGCGDILKPQHLKAPEISIAGDELTYRGLFIADSGARVQAAALSHKVRTLRISSGGGDVDGAIDTARWVHGNGMNVIVDGPCLSSCANYIFLAGREKHIVGKGYVAWHGNVEQLRHLHASGKRNVEPQVLGMLEATSAKERAFYADTKLNGYIAWFGKIAPYNAYNFYFMSKADMEYFGLTGLQVRSDYLATDLSRINRREKRTLRLLQVDRAVTNPGNLDWMTHGRAKNSK